MEVISLNAYVQAPEQMQTIYQKMKPNGNPMYFSINKAVRNRKPVQQSVLVH